MQSTYSKLQSRVATAAVLIAAVSLLILLAAFTSSGKSMLVFAFVVVVLISAYEACMVCASQSSQIASDSASVLQRIIVAVGAGLPALLVAYWYFSRPLEIVPVSDAVGRAAAAAVLSGFLVCAAGVIIFRNSLTGLERLVRDLAPIFVLVGVGGAFLVQVPVLAGSGVERGGLMLLFLLTVVCVNDTAAYFVGSRIRGPKLGELSPNKTIAGSLAGMLFGVLCGAAVGKGVGLNIPVGYLILGSGLLVVAAQSADLLKSYLKRLYGVKDTGTILPGHGGVLDRIDGVLGAAPLVTVLLLGWQY